MCTRIYQLSFVLLVYREISRELSESNAQSLPICMFCEYLDLQCQQSYHSDDSPVSGEYSEMNKTSSLFRTSDLIRNYQTTSY